MVLATALISLAVLGPAAEPQSAAVDDSKPYTVEGVRRASGAGTEAQPQIETATVARDRKGYRMALESRAVTADPCSLVVTGCAPTWRIPSNPTWHDQFVAMAGPQNYMVPYTGMNNGETLQAVTTSMGFGLAIQAIASAIQGQIVKISADRKQKKMERARAEIQAELVELERLNAAAKK